MYLVRLQIVFVFDVCGGQSMSEYSQYPAFPTHCCILRTTLQWNVDLVGSPATASYSQLQPAKAATEVGGEVEGQCCARSAIDSTGSGTLEAEPADSPEMKPISVSICTF